MTCRQPQSRQGTESRLRLARGQIEKCKTEVAAAKAMQPSLPALPAMPTSPRSPSCNQPLTVKLRAYFEQGNYEDDKLAIEIHPRLMEAYGFARPTKRSATRSTGNEDRLAGEQLAEPEKTEGKKLLWHHKKMLIDAKTLVGFASVTAPSDVKDPAALQAAVSSFDTSMAALLEYYAKNKEVIEKKSMYWSSR